MSIRVEDVAVYLTFERSKSSLGFPSVTVRWLLGPVNGRFRSYLHLNGCPALRRTKWIT